MQFYIAEALLINCKVLDFSQLYQEGFMEIL